MSLENVGRWTRLGAMMVSVGDCGRLEIIPPAKSFLVAMNCADLVSAKVALNALPSVHIEEGKSDNDSFTVIMENWSKYQNDSSVYERVKRLRCKRRGEERRKEESRLLEKTPDQNHPSRFQQPTPQEVTAYAKTIGFDLDGQKFVDHYAAAGWMRGKSKIKDWKACVRTWKQNRYSSGSQGTNEKQHIVI